MAAQAAPHEAQCSYIDLLSFFHVILEKLAFELKIVISTPDGPEKTLPFGAFFELFPEGHVTLSDGFDIILE